MKKISLSLQVFIPVLVSMLAISFVIAACGGAAATPGTGEQPAAPAQTQAIINPTPLATQFPQPTAIPAIPEQRRLTIEYPAKIRAGDSDVVRLTLEVDTLGNVTPTAQIGGNVVTGQIVTIPNLYDSHYVIAEAKFDMAGMEITPAELSSQTLSPGQSVTFYWSIRPQDVGVYRGTIWFYLRFVDKVSQEESRVTVSAQLVKIEAVNFFGLSANVVRITGGLGSVVGAVIGLPFFDDIVKYIFGRRRKRRT